MTSLILASTSPYRRALLARLGLPFETFAPAVDETAREGEAPEALARRLATAKAESSKERGAIVIGSDQVASLDGAILRKPGTAERAVNQLLGCRGRTVDFHTAVTVIRGETRLSTVDHTRVVFRALGEASIRNYVRIENAFDCAGGFKAEGLGVALFERIESEDPTALIGLPLIWLAAALREMGCDPLAGLSSS